MLAFKHRVDVIGPPGASPKKGKCVKTLRRTSQGLDRLVGPGLFLAMLLLLLGWLSPLMTVKTLVIFSEAVSLMEGLQGLWEADRFVLFLIVVLFAVAFPFLKLLFAAWLWYRMDLETSISKRALTFLEELGRWSMLDVFIVAQMVAAIQISLIADVEMHFGLYAFIAAVLTSMVLVRRLVRLVERNVGS